MASSSSSSSSSKHGKPTASHSHVSANREKKRPSIDNYRYLAASLLGQQLPKRMNSRSHRIPDDDTLYITKLDQNQLQNVMEKSKAENELKSMRNLAKEMGKMLSNAKAKGTSSEFLHMFSTTLKNFVGDKPVAGSEEEKDLHVKNTVRRKVVKEREEVKAKRSDTIRRHHKAIPSSTRMTKSPAPPSPSSSEFTVLSDREKSVITTTTVTRTKLREPMMRLIESSKTNMLHRCYGKQSVKVLPLVYKNGKKSSFNNTNCQRPAAIKSKNPVKSIKPQQSSTNQQMRTIYENEQFDKSNSVSKQTTLSRKVPSVILTKSEGQPVALDIKTSKKNVKNFSESEVKKPVLHDESTTPSENISCDIDNDLLQLYNSDQDNSLVQRLTSFWNKKINTNLSDRLSGSDKSSTSSQTFILNTDSEHGLNSKKDLKVRKSSSRNISELRNKNSNVKIEGEDKSELPDFKMGLMDELLKVLRNENTSNDVKFIDSSTIVGRNKQNNEQDKNTTNSGRSSNSSSKTRCSDSIQIIKIGESDKIIDTKQSTCTINTISTDGYADGEEEEYSTEDNTALDSDDANVNNQSLRHCDEQTFEAVQTCLTRRITIRNFNTNQSDEISTFQNVSQSKYVDYENINQDETVVGKPDEKQDSHDMRVCVSETKSIKSKCSLSNLTTDSKEQITASIINVYDVINNLRNLINLIETIPEELKRLDLHTLPIPDGLRKTLTFIISNNVISPETGNISKDLFFVSHLKKHSISDNECIGKKSVEKITECCTRQCIVFTCYFPSTFTMPIFENVANPIELILYPKRYDYLQLQYLKKNALSLNEDAIDCTDVHSEKPPSPGQHNVMETKNQKYACITKVVAKTHSPHFTVFYGTLNSDKVVATKGSPSLIFHQPYKKTVTLNKDLTLKSKVCESNKKKHYVTINNSSIELLHTNSTDKSSQKKNTSAEEDNKKCSKVKITGNNGSHQENSTNFVDMNLNELNLCRFHNGSNGRRRRFWRQSNIEDDNSIPTGGSGDYGGVTIPYPCRRTSSMSVTFSGSLNDSNSQPDIHVNESENRLRSLTGHSNIPKPQSEVDTLSCNVIHEICEERMSDIDDCVMIDHHLKSEIGSNDVTPHTLSDSSHIQDSENRDKNEHNFDEVNSKTDDEIEFLQNRATSTTELSINEPLLRDIGTMTDISNENCSENSIDDNISNKITKNREYIVLCCNTPISKRVQKVLAQKSIANKYDLDDMFKNDPDLKQELSKIIDLDNLCDKEKQLIAVCLVLLKRNITVYGKSQLNYFLLRFKEMMTVVWNKTSKKVNKKITHVKEKLIMKYEKQTKLILDCQYKELIKIIYTTLISLMLCFIIQKHFCGITLPICFPW